MTQPEEGSFRTFSDAKLIELLHTAGDSLPLAVVDEILDRGTRMVPFLTVIITDKTAWTRPLPDWWAVVHATYILGGFEAPEALPGLLAALRWSDAFDSEWITEDLPSMFGQIGKPAYEPLEAIVLDVSAGWGARSIALLGMASVCIRAPLNLGSFLDFLAELVTELNEPVPLRQTAANILLDFRAQQHRSALIQFGREEVQRRDEITGYEGAFYDWEVDDFLADEAGIDLDFYQRDWLAFYDPEERERRHDFWSDEKSRGESVETVFVDGDEYASCPCGSGRPYAECCMRKIH